LEENSEPSWTSADGDIDDTMGEMVVTRVTRSLSPLSPLNLPLDLKYDWSSFTIYPELNLGDLAMPNMPVPDLGLNDGPLDFDEMVPDSSSPVVWDLSAKYLNQCDAYFTSSNSANSPSSSSSPTQTGTISRPHPLNAFPLGYPDSDFATSIGLISRATAALAPFSRFASDAQLLLQDLRTLRLQLQLLRKPLPFLAKSINYYNTVREVALDIREPLQVFLERLEKMCGVEDIDGQRLGLAYTSTAFQLRKLEWVRGVKDDARRLRGMIGARSTTISSLMTLVSM
jgi:hypothetical protein